MIVAQILPSCSLPLPLPLPPLVSLVKERMRLEREEATRQLEEEAEVSCPLHQGATAGKLSELPSLDGQAQAYKHCCAALKVDYSIDSLQ